MVISMEHFKKVASFADCSRSQHTINTEYHFLFGCLLSSIVNELVQELVIINEATYNHQTVPNVENKPNKEVMGMKQDRKNTHV